jgi:hypothetical protein
MGRIEFFSKTIQGALYDRAPFLFARSIAALAQSKNAWRARHPLTPLNA